MSREGHTLVRGISLHCRTEYGRAVNISEGHTPRVRGIFFERNMAGWVLEGRVTHQG